METFASSPAVTLSPSPVQRYRYVLHRDVGSQTDPCLLPVSPLAKDLFWLRSFRHYMKSSLRKIKKQLLERDLRFWKEYLGPSGAHKKNQSLHNTYKSFLMHQSTFVEYFKNWVRAKGEKVVNRVFPGEGESAKQDLLTYALGKLMEETQ